MNALQIVFNEQLVNGNSKCRNAPLAKFEAVYEIKPNYL